MPKHRNKTEELQIHYTPVAQLTPDLHNARLHNKAQITAIAASIHEFGWTNPIQTRPDGRIIAGHARLAAAQRLGITHVPIVELHGLSKEQCRALAIADNQLPLLAGWNEKTLGAELAARKEPEFDPELIGHDHGELVRLLAANNAGAGVPNRGRTDRPRTAPQAPVSEPDLKRSDLRWNFSRAGRQSNGSAPRQWRHSK
jgi:ParB-like chromosome segregation protein Spo0J